MTSFEKISQGAKLSDCLAISQSSGTRDHKLDRGGEDGNICVNRSLSISASQYQEMQSNMFLDSAFRKGDRQLVGVMGAKNESSLFSSSLSDLFNHKLKLTGNNFVSRQSSTAISGKDERELLMSLQETEGQMINNLLPDEEELFSGMVDELGLSGQDNATDDLEDFDVFTYSGGIELESDDPSKVGKNHLAYPWGHHQNRHSIRAVDHASRALPSPKFPNGAVLIDPSVHESSHVHSSFQSPVRLPSIGNEFGHKEANRSFPQVHFDNQGIPSFHPRSPQAQLHNLINIMPQNSCDRMTSIADEIGPTVPGSVNLDVSHLGLKGHAMELSEGAFGYSPNAIHVHQSVASKPNSYQHHHLRSLLVPNSQSFLVNNRAHHIGTLPGSPGAPHLVMNSVSPVRHLQVGSAPVIKASLWERQQIYAGECHEAGYQMGGIRGVSVPEFSASSHREISSLGTFARANCTCAEIPKNCGLNSPQQMSQMFHERNVMNSLSTSFGSPCDRVRNRRNETHLSHTDRKHYELNMDRILRGEDYRTTLMIKNIPNKYTSKMLLSTIDEQHRGQYDFIYLPIDFKNKCNMGYAFINMVDPLQIVAFHQTFEGRRWEKFNSEKVASLAYARIQGKGALVAHFQNSSLMNEDKRCRPILFHTDGPNAGDQEPFPMGTNFRPKPGRLHFQVTGDEEEE